MSIAATLAVLHEETVQVFAQLDEEVEPWHPNHEFFVWIAEIGKAELRRRQEGGALSYPKPPAVDEVTCMIAARLTQLYEGSVSRFASEGAAREAEEMKLVVKLTEAISRELEAAKKESGTKWLQ
jgi:hypothetical protein